MYVEMWRITAAAIRDVSLMYVEMRRITAAAIRDVLFDVCRNAAHHRGGDSRRSSDVCRNAAASRDWGGEAFNWK